MSFLLDTNIISEVGKPSGDVAVKGWFAAVPAGELYLSALAVGEIRRGIANVRPRDPVRAAAYEAWLVRLYQTFTDRILPITAEIAETWGRLDAVSTLPVIAGLQAATALTHNFTFVTRNTADVGRTGVLLLNPFPRSG